MAQPDQQPESALRYLIEFTEPAMDIRRRPLLAILQDARLLLALEDNNFMWSYWEDADEALREIDELIEKEQSGGSLGRGELEVLFLPTGPLQEVSLSSGWGEEFLALAQRFDAASKIV